MTASLTDEIDTTNDDLQALARNVAAWSREAALLSRDIREEALLLELGRQADRVAASEAQNRELQKKERVYRLSVENNELRRELRQLVRICKLLLDRSHADGHWVWEPSSRGRRPSRTPLLPESHLEDSYDSERWCSRDFYVDNSRASSPGVRHAMRPASTGGACGSSRSARPCEPAAPKAASGSGRRRLSYSGSFDSARIAAELEGLTEINAAYVVVADRAEADVKADPNRLASRQGTGSPAGSAAVAARPASAPGSPRSPGGIGHTKKHAAEQASKFNQEMDRERRQMGAALAEVDDALEELKLEVQRRSGSGGGASAAASAAASASGEGSGARVFWVKTGITGNTAAAAARGGGSLYGNRSEAPSTVRRDTVRTHRSGGTSYSRPLARLDTVLQTEVEKLKLINKTLANTLHSYNRVTDRLEDMSASAFTGMGVPRVINSSRYPAVASASVALAALSPSPPRSKTRSPVRYNASVSTTYGRSSNSSVPTAPMSAGGHLRPEELHVSWAPTTLVRGRPYGSGGGLHYGGGGREARWMESNLDEQLYTIRRQLQALRHDIVNERLAALTASASSAALAATSPAALRRRTCGSGGGVRALDDGPAVPYRDADRLARLQEEISALRRHMRDDRRWYSKDAESMVSERTAKFRDLQRRIERLTTSAI
ncbi:hypothetical protein VOLCADRAFT_107567 [Volvox carteri f. nagariensis]|uniref:Uncharacterized protein n=1 Tax=Volvox carteri f. nagariensis TaxID=3068 RepID=D8UEZ8_VOLCA|nr:uncharacterized protein VOLCADRAFT_107567 [Volvox carteri f. nagariensis]EFJ41681.1 hypothetical protein VOLCADRAFT_107567 [Volvox carteri f. nagariensis]|eukprot:XP_002957183.1 hypothetical protein VOLCADRAFT_107567 [Volvox carteri f. nagariensis]